MKWNATKWTVRKARFIEQWVVYAPDGYPVRMFSSHAEAMAGIGHIIRFLTPGTWQAISE